MVWERQSHHIVVDFYVEVHHTISLVQLHLYEQLEFQKYSQSQSPSLSSDGLNRIGALISDKLSIGIGAKSREMSKLKWKKAIALTYLAMMPRDSRPGFLDLGTWM